MCSVTKLLTILGAWETEEFEKKLGAITACQSLIEYGIILFLLKLMSNNTTSVCCFQTLWLLCMQNLVHIYFNLLFLAFTTLIATC